ncbi:MAG: hypothetical protein PHC89_01375 [Candidatus Pacebacteria bacterium]|nr:hypothetical protein [Candidatus Paceibacterota bacterium]
MKKFFILFIFVFSLSLFTPQKTEALFDVGSLILVAKEYGMDTLTTIINSRIMDKLVSDTVNWANGGFDGEPGFINNWEDYLKGTEQDVFIGAFSVAEKATSSYIQNFCNLDCSGNSPENIQADYEECLAGGAPVETCDAYANAASADYQQCMANLEQGAGTCQMLDIGAQAQSNYNAWNSGELDSYRLAAESIALIGGQRFNSDPLKALIEGQGETLTKLLGSKSEVENFKNDFSVGGIRGWIALADPHNFPLGQSTLIESALSQKTGEKVQNVVEDLQTPNKFLDRKWCLERDDDNNCTKEFTGTPGALIESKIKSTADSDSDRLNVARELSDVLARALGKLTDGLLQAGFNKLTQSGSSGASAQPFQPAQFFTTGYQNEFDILGLGDLSPSGSLLGGGTGGGNTQTPIFDPETGTFTPLRGGDGSLPYIGGPEDAVNTSWNEGPEIIIDLQSVLENSINLIQEELTLLTETEKILRDGKDNVMKLDRCIPGPKFGWEDRLRDNLNLTGDSNDEESAYDRLGLQETRRMANDNMVNIPGASQMRGTVNALLSQNGENQFEEVSNERNRKQTYLAILKNMKSSIQQDFNNYKGAIDSHLVIFEEDWNKLSDTEKIALFSIPERDENGDIIYVPVEVGSSGTIVVNENQERPLYIMEKYYLFKPGETPASVFANNPDAVKKAVLSYSWDLWQRKKGEEPASGTTPNGVTQKSNLRYQYYAMSKYLTTESDILDAEMKKDEVTQSNKTIIDLLHDCMQLKLYALGYSDGNGENTEMWKRLDQTLSQEPSRSLGMLIGGMSVERADHGSTAYQLNVDNARTDQQIKNYLLQEKAKQENNQPSNFKTSIITNGVEESILGFEETTISWEEVAHYGPPGHNPYGSPDGDGNITLSPSQTRKKYFDDFYEKDEDLWQPYYKYSNGIAEIDPERAVARLYQFDYMTMGWPRGGNGKGTLYCRVVTSFDARGWHGAQNLPKCYKDWYSTSNITYDLALMNIR